MAKQLIAHESNSGIPDGTLLRPAIVGLLSKLPDIADVASHVDETQGLIHFNVKAAFKRVSSCIGLAIPANATAKAARSKKPGNTPPTLLAQLSLDCNKLSSSHISRRPALYVFCIYELEEAEKDLIQNSFGDSVTEAIWICGEKLFALFETHYPEILADEARALRRHIEALALVATDTAPLRRFAGIGGYTSVEPSDPQFFVPVTLDRTFSEFLPGDLFFPLPKEDRLTQEWSQKDFDSIRDATKYSFGFLRHTRRWDFCLADKGVIDSLEQSTAAFIDALESAVECDYAEQVAAAARSPARNRAPRNTEAGKPKTKIISKQRREQILRIHKSLQEAWGEVVCLTRDMVLNPPFRSMFKSIRHQAKQKVREKDINRVVTSGDFRRACSFDDFCRATPGQMLTLQATYRVEIGTELLQHTQASVLIAGGPGSGKSSFCRWNALRDAERAAKSGANITPVLVPLHSIASVSGLTFQQVFLRAGAASGLLDNTRESLGSSSRLRLYLDGLDEVPSPEIRKDIVLLAASGKNIFPHLQIILTSRDHILEPWLHWLPRLELSGLKPSQLRTLAAKWIGGDADRFMDEVGKAPGLKSVVVVPLLATLTILVFRHGNKLPANRINLYKMFTELLSGGWNLAKGIRRSTTFDADAKVRCLSRLAFRAHQRQEKEFSIQLVRKAVSTELGTNSDRVGIIMQELFADGIVSKSAGTVQFRHFSFQEYLAARYLIGDITGADGRAILREYISDKSGSHWWEEVLRFYFEMSSRPAEAAALVREMAPTEFYSGRPQKIIGWLNAAFPEANIF